MPCLEQAFPDGWFELSMADADYTQVGPAVGEPFPDFELPDSAGNPVRLHRWRDGRRALVVFYRSAAW
jgi:hypothetical protein